MFAIHSAYFALMLGSFICALVTVPLAMVFGRRFGFIDNPGGRKIHESAIVRCGGLGIWLAFMIVFCGTLLLLPYVKHSPLIPPSLAEFVGNIRFVASQLLALMFGATVIFLTGLWDDHHALSPRVKLCLELLAILPLPFAGISANCFLESAILSGIVTVFWILLITNAFNLLDNMNGLSAGVAVVACLNFYLISQTGGEWFMMAMFAILGGAIAGFIPYNFPKAKLFMGDSGSLFIGYMIGSLSVLVTYYKSGIPTALPVVAPFIVLAVPLYDTLSVMYIRYKNGKPLMVGDKNHISHRLERLGFSRTGAVVMVWSMALAFGLGAANLRYLDFSGALLALIQIAMLFVILHIIERTANRAR